MLHPKATGFSGMPRPALSGLCLQVQLAEAEASRDMVEHLTQELAAAQVGKEALFSTVSRGAGQSLILA